MLNSFEETNRNISTHKGEISPSKFIHNSPKKIKKIEIENADNNCLKE